MAEDEEGEGLDAALLIDDRNPAHGEDEDDDDDGGDNGVSHHENRTSSLNAFIWTLTFTAGISGLLFGYECVRPFPSPLPSFKSSFFHKTKNRNRFLKKKKGFWLK